MRRPVRLQPALSRRTSAKTIASTSLRSNPAKGRTFDGAPHASRPCRSLSIAVCPRTPSPRSTPVANAAPRVNPATAQPNRSRRRATASGPCRRGAVAPSPPRLSAEHLSSTLGAHPFTHTHATPWSSVTPHGHNHTHVYKHGHEVILATTVACAAAQPEHQTPMTFAHKEPVLLFAWCYYRPRALAVGEHTTNRPCRAPTVGERHISAGHRTA
ncbi:hypothetical protein PVAP13_7KG066458 [Panicum virgatum]|uniref:Uncharacterized protein n=1 Tax=Panicum virgatum TaxID=38727 RepID=A0A8T0QJS0_PANVG|nr:hypothetical protein PVAP13_7KG066458 [Panicum virgatum]